MPSSVIFVSFPLLCLTNFILFVEIECIEDAAVFKRCKNYNPVVEARFVRTRSSSVVYRLIVSEGRDASVDCQVPADLQNGTGKILSIKGKWTIVLPTINDSGFYKCVLPGNRFAYIDLLVLRNYNQKLFIVTQTAPTISFRKHIGGYINMSCPLENYRSNLIFWDTLIHERDTASGTMTSKGWLLVDTIYPTFFCRNVETEEIGVIRVDVYDSLQHLYFHSAEDKTQQFESLASYVWLDSRKTGVKNPIQFCRECGPILPAKNPQWPRRIFSATDIAGAVYNGWLPKCCRASDFYALKQIVTEDKRVILETSWDLPQDVRCPKKVEQLDKSLCQYAVPLGYCGKGRGRNGCGATVALEAYEHKESGQLVYWSSKMKRRAPSSGEYRFKRVMCYLWDLDE